MTRRTARPAPILVLGLLITALAACGQGAATPNTSPAAALTTAPGATPGAPGATTAPATTGPAGVGSDAAACDLLGDADIQEITGNAVVTKSDHVADTIYANHCRWNLSIGEINLGVISPGGKDWYDEHIGILNGLKPVPGLPADIAMLQDISGSIFAVKGDTLVDLFTVGVAAPDADILRRVLENLASRA